MNFDSIGNYSIDHIGVRRVRVTTTGQERTRVSVAFSASASGTKLKPVILIPRKKQLKDFIPPANVVIVYGTSGTFNHKVLRENFLNRVLIPYKMAEGNFY